MLPITRDLSGYMAFWLRVILLTIGVEVGMLAAFLLLLRYWIVPALATALRAK